MAYADSAELYRTPVTVDCSASGGTVDVTITIPTHHPLWDYVQSDGDDLRVYDADGVTLLAYDLTSWTYASRVGVISVDGVVLPATLGVYRLLVYYGDPAAIDQTVAVTIASAKTGHMEVGKPLAGTPVVAIRSQPFGSVKPALYKMQKGADEHKVIFWDLTDLLLARAEPYEGSLLHEEPFGAVVSIEAGAVAEASMIEQGSTRFHEWMDLTRRRQAVSMIVKAGVTGTQYTIILDLLTRVPVQDQFLQHQPRALLSVLDAVE